MQSCNFAAFSKHPMALVLCIDTALETATVGVCNEESVLASAVQSDQKQGAAFVQPAIQEMLRNTSISFSQLDAVAVVNGPGSYTGLRVGLASAKGICYALNKPLIVINTLEVMAVAAIKTEQNKNALYCPMIDARRNEVFTAIYDASLVCLLPPQGLIIEADSFAPWLTEPRQLFFFWKRA